MMSKKRLEDATEDLREGQEAAHEERAELVEMMGMMRAEIENLQTLVQDLRAERPTQIQEDD